MEFSLSEPDEDGYRTMRARMKLGIYHSPHFVKHFTDRLKLTMGDESIRFNSQITPDGKKQLEAEMVVNEQMLQHPLVLTLKGQQIGRFGFNDQGELLSEKENDILRLSPFELRGLSRAKADEFPYPRETLQEYDAAHHRPITDLHTHLTSQISGHDLVQLAESASPDIYYPVELLKKLDLSDEQLPADRAMKPCYRFSPTAAEGLECERGAGDVESVRIKDLSRVAKARLERALSVPDDRVTTFNDIERTVYRFRNPFSKNPDLIEPIILKVAEDYLSQGVGYSEQAVTGALDPNWLEKALPALEKAEKLGHSMRFLVGIPRVFSSTEMDKAIAKTKLIAASPYIVGVDFIGYEADKTHNFANQLNQLAEWASTHPEYDFLLRVHAGETGKNLDNVSDAMKVADNHEVRLRIGHGIHIDMSHGLDQLAMRMAAAGKLAVEFNPDSNMALNNIDVATDIPVNEWRDLGVPILLATDGGGAYQCGLEDSAMAGLHAGLSIADLTAIREWENDYVIAQQKTFAIKEAAFTQTYASQTEFLNAYRVLNDAQQQAVSKPASSPVSASPRGDTRRVPDDIRHKTPLLIAGASGSSWSAVGEDQKHEIEVGIRMLTELLDPSHVYFAVGRTKRDGVTNMVDTAISKHKKGLRDGELCDENKKFSLIGLVSTHGIDKGESRPINANHIWELQGGLLNISNEMTRFIKRHSGAALYIGGSAFTRDFIHLSEEQDIPFGVMNQVQGASSQKARTLDDQHVFEGAVGMVEQVIAMSDRLNKPLFRKDVSLSHDSLVEMAERISHEIGKPKPPYGVIHAASVGGGGAMLGPDGTVVERASNGLQH